jgi:hypothetical protein
MASYGNRTTENAITADPGEDLVKKAIAHIESNTDWRITNPEKFSHTVYYDSKKVGAHFTEVQHKNGTKGILKLQLRPLSFDEGSIIRHISPQLKTDKIRLPELFLDSPWNEKDGYGFLILEDLSHLPKIWSSLPPVAEQDYAIHKKFLKEFLHNVLPVTSFAEKPIAHLEFAHESFNHYWTIAQSSAHKHFEVGEIENLRDIYFQALEKAHFEDTHFTHGHLSGLDILYDEEQEQFILLGNLYWKWRPMYWELTFPTWNSIMQVRDKNFIFTDFLGMVNRWGALWATELYDHDPTTNQQYWINLLAFAMNTIMLDLGASEWKEGEQEEKAALLTCWKEFFNWLIKNKF